MSIDKYDVYIAFRRAQAKALNRPFRIPKDLNKHFETKITLSNHNNIENLSKAFNTRWQNIDIDRYLDYGFQLFGSNFSYNMFFNPKLIMFYIEKDKNLKRETGQIKVNIVNSAKFVKKWMKEKNLRKDLSLITQYCMITVDGIKAPIKHFVLGKVDKYFIVWLIDKKLLTLSDTEEGLIPLICENYRIYLDDIRKIDKFLKELSGRI